MVSCPSSMVSAVCVVPFPPHAGGFLADPFPRTLSTTTIHYYSNRRVAALAYPVSCIFDQYTRTVAL